MATDTWPTKRRFVASLHLDANNPRLGRETSAQAPREIVQYLFEHDKAFEVAQSIATRGYFPNEPLLAIQEGDQVVVVEGNRRLAALKALREPVLLDGAMQRYVERLSRQIENPSEIASVPVTLASSRRATDRQISGRHVGAPVLAWQAENRASFILDKLAEGYTNEQLRDQLGFSLADIQAGRVVARLAALKALREPVLLDGAMQRYVERLSRQIENPSEIASVPVTLASSRRATDRQISGRHVGAPVLAWQAENRASFILDKLAEGYTNEQLRDQLGFSLADIQAARQTRAIADMARSLYLPEGVRAKLENPRVKLFTTIERVFDSSVGRDFLKVEPDSEHGLHGTTTKAEFVRGFTKLVIDVALGKQSSRTLNTNENIQEYFESWDAKERPAKKRGSFIPADIIQGSSVTSLSRKSVQPTTRDKSLRASDTVLPRDFKVKFGNERLKDIRRELVKLKREDFPNAGAVLLRVFFELAVLDYLRRAGELPALIKQLEKKQKRRLPFGAPTMKQLVPKTVEIAKAKLSKSDAMKVEKAVRYDVSAPFTLSELHSFVHQSDLPSARDIYQFWNRTEPLFRLMLEQDVEVTPSE